MKSYLSANFLKQANASASGIVRLSLLTISHPQLPAPIRLVYNNLPITSRGNVFSPCMLSLGRPTDSEQDSPSTALTIQNVDQSAGDAIDSISTAPTFLWETVMSNALDTVEESLEFDFQDAAYDAGTLTGTLGLDRLDKENYPKDTITPANDPGIF